MSDGDVDFNLERKHVQTKARVWAFYNIVNNGQGYSIFDGEFIWILTFISIGLCNLVNYNL